MKLKPVNSRHLFAFDLVPIVAVIWITTLSATLSDWISVNSELKIIGLVTIVLAATRDISAAIRVICVIAGFCSFALGWRFLR